MTAPLSQNLRKRLVRAVEEGASALLATRPHFVSHGRAHRHHAVRSVVKLPEQLFIDTARIPGRSLDKDTILFFEPAWAESRAAAERSANRLSVR